MYSTPFKTTYFSYSSIKSSRMFFTLPAKSSAAPQSKLKNKPFQKSYLLILSPTEYSLFYQF